MQTSRHLPRESGGVPTLPVPESERKEGGQNWNFVLGEGSKNRTRGTVQKWSTEVRGRRDKGIQKWSRKFRDMLVLVFNMFLRPFSAKDVVELTGKVENVLRSESKSAAVHQKETKLDEKGRSASAIMSCRCCIDHPQKWKDPNPKAGHIDILLCFQITCLVVLWPFPIPVMSRWIICNGRNSGDRFRIASNYLHATFCLLISHVAVMVTY